MTKKPKVKKEPFPATLESQQKAKAVDDLKKLNGDPPYDGGSNIVRNDGYFAISLERKYRMSIVKLGEWSGYDEVAKKIKALRDQAAKIK